MPELAEVESEEGASEACQALVPGLICSHRFREENSQQGLIAPTFLCFLPSFLVHRVLQRNTEEGSGFVHF